MKRACVVPSPAPLDFLRGSWGNSQIFGVEDGDVGPSPAPVLPTFQKLGKFHSLSDPLSLLLENGNR